MRWIVIASLLAACTANAPGKSIDASSGGAFGAACTVVSDTSTECSTNVCTDSIDMAGHPVCSEKCMTGSDGTCPEGSMGMKCNGKGYCKP